VDRLILNEKENAMRTSKFLECLKCLESGTSIFILATVMGAVVSPVAALDQNKKDEISFDLVANPKFVECPNPLTKSPGWQQTSVA
jgi:hypothetical protein